MANLDTEITNVAEEMVTTNPSFIDKALPIAGGFGVGLLLGFALDRFVVKPILDKARSKKEAKVEPEKEVEKKPEE